MIMDYNLNCHSATMLCSWFRHFYQFAVVLFTMWTLLLLSWTLTGFRSLPSVLETSLNIFVPDRSAAVPLSVAIWVQILTTFQVFRRCYECMFLSVYSDAKMHVWHYAVGYIFYTGKSALSRTLDPDPAFPVGFARF